VGFVLMQSERSQFCLFVGIRKREPPVGGWGRESLIGKTVIR
jgi:hypothetical protein